MLDARAVDLLAHAVPAATFAPLYVNGGGGLAVRAAAAGLRAQLDKKPAHRPTRPGRLGLPDDVGPGPFRPAVNDPVLADAISGLINGQPARTDAVVDLFGADPTPALAEFQATALSAGFVAATVLRGGRPPRPRGRRRSARPVRRPRARVRRRRRRPGS